MTHGCPMARRLLSMAVMLAIAPVAARAEQGGTGRGTVAPVVQQPEVTSPVAKPTREQWDDFADPVRDVEGWAVERA